jgi:hypothetical protein
MFDEFDTPPPETQLKNMLEALDINQATEQDVEDGIAAAVALAQITAKSLYRSEQIHKNRFSKKPIAIAEDKAFINHCGNMAFEINMLLEHPRLHIQHHQLNGNGFNMNHHFLTVQMKDKTWVVDASAKQFEPQVDTKIKSPVLDTFLENGFFAAEQKEFADGFRNFYTYLDPKANAPDSFNDLLNITQQSKPDMSDIENAFVFTAQKIRRSIN